MLTDTCSVMSGCVGVAAGSKKKTKTFATFQSIPSLLETKVEIMAHSVDAESGHGTS